MPVREYDYRLTRVEHISSSAFAAMGMMVKSWADEASQRAFDMQLNFKGL